MDVKVKEGNLDAVLVLNMWQMFIPQRCSIISSLSLSLSPFSEELKLASHRSQVTFICPGRSEA